MLTENQIGKIVFNSALTVHKKLGPGLLENTYQECLVYELIKAGLFVEKEKALPLVYDDIKLEIGHRIDILVERKFVIEVKSVECLNEVHLAQVLTYLKLSDCKLGFLINFNVSLLRDGVKRLINGHLDS